jgi:CheY-like chemotaxis protein
VCGTDARPVFRKRLRILIWGAGDQQNHFDRILAANVRLWGYTVDLRSASLFNREVGLARNNDFKADVLICDLDAVPPSPIMPASHSVAVSQLNAGGNEALPPISLASLVIALSSRSVSRSTLEQLGAVALLYKPFEMSLLQRYLLVMQQLLLDGSPIQVADAEKELRIQDARAELIRVLVVDDHAEVAETIRQCLECEPRYDVRVAQDGLEALEYCVTWQPACIVTDLLMPWMNGYQVMRSLSAGQRRFKPAIVVLSALPQSESPMRLDYLRGKEVVFVEKPFYLEQLLEAVQQALTQ